jgi:hypothetical protein
MDTPIAAIERRLAEGNQGGTLGGPMHVGFFSAVHETGFGPSRHIAPPHVPGRSRAIAEIEGPTSIAEGDARDP